MSYITEATAAEILAKTSNISMKHPPQHLSHRTDPATAHTVGEASSTTLPTPKVLFVNGSRGSKNYVVCSTRENAADNVVYFPGDVQTFYKDMVADEDYGEFAPFSLECTADLLSRRFPDSNIWIICPSRFTENHLSEYDSLLRPGEGIVHFCTVFASAIKAIETEWNHHYPDETPSTITALAEKPIKLVAFSKGGLVLNNFLAELATTIKLHKKTAVADHDLMLDWEAEYMASQLPNYEPSQRIGRTKTLANVLRPHEQTVLSFIEKVTTIHWVDCHRYPTNPEVVRLIARYITGKDDQLPRSCAIRLYLHLTPRQYCDRRRRWIQRENDDFVALLKESNVPFFLQHYLDDHPKTLQTHFELLKLFHTRPPQCATCAITPTGGGSAMTSLSSCSNAPPTVHVHIPTPTTTNEDTDDTVSMGSACHHTTPYPNTRFYHPAHN